MTGKESQIVLVWPRPSWRSKCRRCDRNGPSNWIHYHCKLASRATGVGLFADLYEPIHAFTEDDGRETFIFPSTLHAGQKPTSDSTIQPGWHGMAMRRRSPPVLRSHQGLQPQPAAVPEPHAERRLQTTLKCTAHTQHQNSGETRVPIQNSE